MKLGEDEHWADDDTSVADARLRRQAGKPVHSGVEAKKPEKSGAISGRAPTPGAVKVDPGSFLSGESQTDVAPRDGGTGPYEAVGRQQEAKPRRSRRNSPQVVRSSERPARPRASHSTEMQFVDPLVDRIVGRKYRIKRHIASGGMGSVYEAEHVKLGHSVAVKVLHTHLVKHSETTKRFVNEAKVAANLDHPNVVRAVDIGETQDGVPFFVLEYLDGQPLSAVLGRGRHLPVRQTLQIAMQILSALEAAHEDGIVHRDIKPENIFLLKRSGDQEHVKVLDFGIAKISSATRATSQGKIFGTPMYMSPEQLKDSSNVDERTDIYAVGVLLYEMLGGMLPFVADGLAELMIATLSNDPTPLDTLRTDLPDGLGDLVRASFSAGKEDRPPTAATLRHELGLYLSSATQMELDHVALDPEAGTLDPEAVRNIQRWRKSASANTSVRPKWQFAAAAVLLLAMGLALGLGLSSVAPKSNPIAIQPTLADEVSRADPFAPATLPAEPTSSATVAASDEPSVEQAGESARDTQNDEASDADKALLDAAEKEKENEASRKAAVRSTKRGTRSGTRRNPRTRARRKVTETEKPTGLGFQDGL